jgi:hypothetical protein
MPGEQSLLPHTSKARLGFHLTQHGIFYKEGDYGTVGNGGHIVHLKDTSGLGYLSNVPENHSFCGPCLR